MAQNMFYPPSGGGSSSNASVGSNGAPAPTSSTEIAGKNAGGNLQPYLAGPNGEFVVQPPLAINVTGTLSALGTLLTQDCSQLQSASIHLTSMGAGNVVIFQVSNDNTNWYSCAMMPGGDLASIITSSATVAGSFTTQLNSRYFRAQVTTYGSGTIIGNAYFKSFGNSPNSVGGYVSAQNYDSTGVGITSTGAALDINLKTSTITLPVSAAALPLPAGAATSALQTALNAQVPTTLGQKAMAASLAIVVASDQTAIPIAQATAANLNATVVQATAANLNVTVAPLTNSSIVKAQLQDNAGTAITVGQKAMAASVPVVLASDQASVPVAATLSAETTKVIGTINVAAAQTLGTVTTVSAVTAITNALPAGTNNIGRVSAGNGTFTDNSGTTSVTPSTSTTLMASNANRKYLLIQNLDTVNNIYINFTSAAANATGSLKILPGGSFVMESTFVSTEAVNVLATVASINFTAKQG